MGENLLQIKLNNNNDNVRTCLAELQDAGDASTREKYYHRKCLHHAQRTFATEDISAATLIRYACDEQLLHSVQRLCIFGFYGAIQMLLLLLLKHTHC